MNGELTYPNGVVVFDLDNCISHDAWRRVKIEPAMVSAFRRYHAYHSLCSHDRYGNRELVDKALDAGHSVFILTARPELYRPQTEFWLMRNGIPYVALLMRPERCTLSSAGLKRLMVEGWLPEYGVVAARDVVAAYDDRPDVVAGWRAAGVAKAEVAALDHGHASMYAEMMYREL